MGGSFVAQVEPGERQIDVRLQGGLEFAAPGALGSLVDAVPAPDGRTVVLHLAQVPRIGALGVASLTTLVGGLQEAGHDVRIQAGGDAQRRVLRAFGREVAKPELPGPDAAVLVERLGERTIEWRDAFYRFTLLWYATLYHAMAQPFRRRGRRDLTQQAVVRMGVGATPLVALIAFLIGFILALQGGELLKVYGQTLLIADLVGLSVTKEIAPLLTAVLVAGRSGSSLTAEIGTMKVSEEVDALEVIGVNPIEYLVAPRMRALAIVLPVLTIVADVVAIAGGLCVGWFVYDIVPPTYIDQTLKRVVLTDVLGGLLKALCFSFVIVSVAAYQGFSTAGGAAGVGKFTTRSVVQAIIWIIIVDAVFTALLAAIP